VNHSGTGNRTRGTVPSADGRRSVSRSITSGNLPLVGHELPDAGGGMFPPSTAAESAARPSVSPERGAVSDVAPARGGTRRGTACP